MNRRRALGALIGLGAAGCRPLLLPPQQPEEPASGVFFTAGVPFVPTRPRVMDVMLSIAEIGPDDMVYDLGCGDGRLVIAACKRFGARGLGVDLDSELIAMAQAQAQWERVGGRARFVAGDLFEVDLTPASVVMLYLSVEINLKLRPKMLRQLAPGVRIVSNRFDMADVWVPDRTVQVEDNPVHFWRIPPRPG